MVSTELSKKGRPCAVERFDKFNIVLGGEGFVNASGVLVTGGLLPAFLPGGDSGV